jgi:pyridoxamine 5'-phosphate oxidase family protein
MIFTEAERAYLAHQPLGRLATVDGDGTPAVRPLGFRLNEDGTIDTGAPALRSTLRYRNVTARPKVGFVVDDMTPDEPGAIKPGMGRGVEVRGWVEITEVAVPPVAPEWFGHEILRLHPTRVLSWHIDPDNPDGESRTIAE